MKLTDLPEIASRDVTLRGVAVTVRPVSAALMDAAQACFPRPVAPMGIDPTKGSNSPAVPMTWDVGWQRAVALWAGETNALEVALALGLEVGGAAEETTASEAAKAGHMHLKAWAVEAVYEVKSKMTKEEIDLVLGAVAEVAKGLVEGARKN